ncbi:MAG: hypothetical protein CMI51_04740 [Paracoccus sp.]|nr:hypothetical protein [Paracoccus sp. (in: a-proteobacteria)]
MIDAGRLLPRLRPVPGLVALAVLAACAKGPAIGPAPPPPRPDNIHHAAESADQARLRKARAQRNRAANEAAGQAVQTSGRTSRQQRLAYAETEARLLSQGRLRRDRIPQDAPIDAESLTRDFLAIALRDEYSRDGGNLVASARIAPLRRWQEPVAMQVEFGASADAATRSLYRTEIGRYAARLSRISGHPVRLTASGGNFIVLVLSDDERRRIGPRLARLVPGIPERDIRIIENLDDDNFCTAFAYAQGAAADYSRAVVLIRAELPPLLRDSCLHEELAQGMGLSNDSPDARPSIFNDDEEFALLTRHDELLLQILYDRRLRPGMTEAEAAPIVRRIAGELLGESA